MHQNVFLTELIPDESPPELQQIRTSIRHKLISKGIPVTTNIDEAHFMIIFFTRGFIRRYLDIIFNLPKLPLGHSLVFWDKKEYPPGEPTLQLLLHITTFDTTFDDYLAEELEADVTYGTSDFQFNLREALRYMEYHARIDTVVLHNRYVPRNLTDTNSVIDAQVEIVASYVNPFSIDFCKLDGIESDLVKIVGLLDNPNDDKNGDTQFLVISGCAQTHDITTITKGLSFIYLRSHPPYFQAIRYLDNCRQYCPKPPLPFTLAHGILAHCLTIELADYHKGLLDLKELYCDDIKAFLTLEGISSLDELKEIRKLGDLCNLIGRCSMVILSTGLDIFRGYESNFKSHDSVFLGYVDGAAPAGQTEFMDDAADGWRPFCLKLNDSQLGDVIEMAECRAKEGERVRESEKGETRTRKEEESIRDSLRTS